MLELVKEYIGEIFVVGITAVITYLSGRKMGEAEVKKTQADAIKGMQEAYDLFVSDMKEANNDLRLQVQSFKAEYIQIRKESHDAKMEAIELKKEIALIKKKQKELETALDECMSNNK